MSDISKKLQYMYSYNEASDGQGTDFIGVHRVRKVTPKFIFVEYLPTGEWNPDAGVNMYMESRSYDRVCRFSRDEVEDNGFARSRNWYEPNLYLDPQVIYNERMAAKLPPCAKALGLRPQFTAEQVRAAYRQLAKQYHPDAGGDAQQFRELQRNYEQAIKMVSTL